MKITSLLQTKINNIAAMNYLSAGNYEDLTKAASNNNGDEDVIIWEAFEGYEVETVLDHVNALAENISELIKNL